MQVVVEIPHSEITTVTRILNVSIRLTYLYINRQDLFLFSNHGDQPFIT